jgi:hypothetical protein
MSSSMLHLLGAGFIDADWLHVVSSGFGAAPTVVYVLPGYNHSRCLDGVSHSCSGLVHTGTVIFLQTLLVAMAALAQRHLRGCLQCTQM